MNERILRLIVEAISNESVKKIFDNMLEKQTQSIVEQLSMASEEEHTIAEIERCRYLLEEEQKRRTELESQIKELVYDKEKLTANYEEHIKRLIGSVRIKQRHFKVQRVIFVDYREKWI